MQTYFLSCIASRPYLLSIRAVDYVNCGNWDNSYIFGCLYLIFFLKKNCSIFQLQQWISFFFRRSVQLYKPRMRHAAGSASTDSIFKFHLTVLPFTASRVPQVECYDATYFPRILIYSYINLFVQIITGAIVLLIMNTAATLCRPPVKMYTNSNSNNTYVVVNFWSY